jgi:hypothetical protein
MNANNPDIKAPRLAPAVGPKPREDAIRWPYQCEHFSIGETEFILDFSFKITSKGCAARLYGEPGDCYPAEDPEYDVALDGIHEDLGSGWMTPSRECPAWLRAACEELLANSDAVSDAVDFYLDEKAA